MPKRKTQEQAEIEAKGVGAELLTVYVSSRRKCGYRCLKCDYVRQAKPNNIQQKQGCPKCQEAPFRKTQEQAEIRDTRYWQAIIRTEVGVSL